MDRTNQAKTDVTLEKYDQPPPNYDQQAGAMNYSQQQGNYNQQQGNNFQQQGNYNQQQGNNFQQQGNYNQQQGNTYQQQGIGYSNSALQMSNSDLTVVVQQPRPDKGLMIGTIHGHREWSTGICDCFSDCSNCMFTWCCYPCAMCRLATRTGECCLMPACVPGAGIAMRARIRTLGGIQGTMCNDCCIFNCCGPCAACQMARELDIMGVP